MKKMLRGTYKLDKPIKMKSERTKRKNISEEFESNAVKKLGGSIAFVSKSKLLWSGEDEKKIK